MSVTTEATISGGTPNTMAQPPKPVPLVGRSAGMATTTGLAANHAPSLAGKATTQSYASAYFTVAADFLCTMLAYGLPAEEGSETPTTQVAMCTWHRADALYRHLLVDSTPMESVGVPMFCAVCNPRYAPITPDRP